MMTLVVVSVRECNFWLPRYSSFVKVLRKTWMEIYYFLEICQAQF